MCREVGHKLHVGFAHVGEQIREDNALEAGRVASDLEFGRENSSPAVAEEVCPLFSSPKNLTRFSLRAPQRRDQWSRILLGWAGR
jgi:hypothetical protein